MKYATPFKPTNTQQSSDTIHQKLPKKKPNYQEQQEEHWHSSDPATQSSWTRTWTELTRQ